MRKVIAFTSATALGAVASVTLPLTSFISTVWFY